MAAAATLTVVELLGEALEPAALFEPSDEQRPGAEALAVVDRALRFIGAGILAPRDGEPP